MRHSSLLLALVASVIADDVAQSRRSASKDSTLESREPVEISQSLETRFTPAAIKSWTHKRDSDSGDYHGPFRHAHDENDDDDDDDDHDHDNDNEDLEHINGGAIAGAVVGAFVLLLILLAIWYFIRIRPKRKQRLADTAARKEAELESGYARSPESSIHPTAVAAGTPAGFVNEDRDHIRFAPTPYPERAPSIQTMSSMSGLALPTPALTPATYSPSVTTTTASPPTPPHRALGASEKPPSYAALAALQSNVPQPEASAYQMGQVPVEAEPPVYHIPLIPQPGVMDMKGEPIARY
ncbi:hypothetical protein M426DRAFT_321449 [Hypoxylon sp. CI-4A]|nr:hypothetical protein M426DRAFT_321449 [Hypoxylon sp. CI-4A]